MSLPTSKLPRTFTLLALLASTALGACGPDAYANRITGAQVDQANGAMLGRTNALSENLAGIQATGRPSNVSVQNGIYLGRDGFRANNGDPLPGQFQGPRGISMNLANKVDIVEFSEILERMTRIPVDWSDLASQGQLSGPTGSAGGGAAAAMGGGDDSAGEGEGAGGNAMQPFQVTQTSNDEDGSNFGAEASFRVNFTGSLSDLLSYVGSRINADWVYRGGQIRFLGPQTRTYTLWSQPNALTSTSTVANSNTASGEGGVNFGGAAQMSTGSSYNYEYWETIESGLAAILPSIGARYSVNKSAGTVIVTGNQAAQDRVSQFIATENQRLSRQVMVKVEVIAFTQADDNAASGNVDAIIDNILGGKFDLTFAGVAKSVDGASSLQGVVAGDGSGGDSSAVINTLAQYGRVSSLQSQSVVAANNAPTPLSLLKQEGYLAASATMVSEDGTTTTLTPGTVTSGLSLVLTPRVLSSGEVIVSYTMNVTENEGFKEVNSGDSMIQTPTITTRTFMQTVNIGSGDTLMIASYDGQRNERKSQGAFNPAFWGLGGGSQIKSEKTRIFLLMTPVVLEGRNNPRGN